MPTHCWQAVVPLLQVGDMVESLDYFREALGFVVHRVWPLAETPRWARISRGEISFILTMDLGTSDRSFIAEKGNGVVFYILCDGIAALYQEMCGSGAIIVQEPIFFGGRQQFTVADVNGYVLTFSEPFDD
jgi:predicted enzyme related to lactoylglutathione lyase